MMNEGKCPIRDDMELINQKLMETDALIIGSPTYGWDVSGAVKTMLDRSSAIYFREIGPLYNEDMPFLGKRPLAGKSAVPVIIAAGFGHERALETLTLYLEHNNKMNVVDKIAEATYAQDVYDLPDVMKHAEQAGEKLGNALKQRSPELSLRYESNNLLA
jgi:multimeric flavodoxin WrbA